MKQLKLTAIICLLFSTSLFFTSCKKEDHTKYTITAAPVNFSQIALPAGVVIPPSAATGTLTGVYTPFDKTFNYTVSWSGLSGNAASIHIHGLADSGYIALPAPLGPYANGIVQLFTSGFPKTSTGSFTGSLYIDGNTIREENLLSGKFFIDVHSVTVPYVNTGEIRGQIKFDK
jgi:hypothetical protein